MLKQTLLAAVAVIALTGVAQADDYSYSRDTTTTRSVQTNATTTNDGTFLGLVDYQGPYISVLGGWNKTEDDSGLDFDGGWLGGVAVGGKTAWARAELEATYRNNEIDTFGGDDISSWGLMANGYWDIETGTIVTPYFGAGIGAAYVDLDTAIDDDSVVRFAYQGMVGVNFNVAPQWKLGAEYRYFSTTEVSDVDNDNHAVLGKVTYQF